MREYAFEKLKEFKYGTGKSLFCWPGPALALQQSQSGEWAPIVNTLFQNEHWGKK